MADFIPLNEGSKRKRSHKDTGKPFKKRKSSQSGHDDFRHKSNKKNHKDKPDVAQNGNGDIVGDELLDSSIDNHVDNKTVQAKAPKKVKSHPRLSGISKEDQKQLNRDRREQMSRRGKRKTEADEDLDEHLRLNLSVSRQNNEELVTFIEARIKQFQPNITEVELEDQRISAEYIVDTSSMEPVRKMDKLPQFLQELAAGEDLAKCTPKNGTPHTLVVTSAGVRAANLARALRVYQSKNAMVAKLFAKHIKLEESITKCKQSRINIGVGTPHRLMELFDSGALTTNDLKRIVIDASHIDAKSKGVLELRDTLFPVIKLLNLPQIKERCQQEESPLRIIFF